MSPKAQLILVILTVISPSLEDISDNTVEIEEENPFAEATAAILKAQNAQNIGGMLNNLMQSDGAKQIGDLLSGDNAAQILQGLGSVVGQNQGGGFDSSAMLGMAMNMFQQKTGKRGESEGFDMGNLFTLLGGLLSPQGGENGENMNLLNYLPMIMQTINSFTGPEAQERAHAHDGHAGLLPPLLEKIHLLFDHFVNSEMARQLFSVIGAEKFVKVFADENGRVSYRRFVDMFENHSFRRHWIRMVTDRFASIISFVSDPKIQTKYLTAFQHFINSILKSQGFPKSALFDQNRPTESITALANHFTQIYLNMKINSKQYVKPAVEYVQELMRLAQKKGILNLESGKLSDKLADTINLEVIEPIARVNRAYRFARKVPKCDKYVMCLVNHQADDEKSSLPGLKPLLSKSASLIYSWFLSSHTRTPFLTLYKAITEDNPCQSRFLEACNDFHIEESKVHKEYVHNEL